MSYVLVSLVGDEATQTADAFAAWFAERKPPAARFREEAPDHDAVASAVRQCGQALVFGHDGGGTLRARRRGPAWATADQFAHMFRDARTYAYACDTMAERHESDLGAFGHESQRLRVRVFAGHCTGATAAVDSESPVLSEALREAVAAVLCAFLDGENDAAHLRLVAEQSFELVDEGFFRMGGVPLAIRSMMRGLVVAS
jgi:hypothetical protein